MFEEMKFDARKTLISAKEVWGMYEQGQAPRDIAKALSVPYPRIVKALHRMRKQLGIQAPPKNRKYDHETVARLIKEGLSNVEIAERMQVSAVIVKRVKNAMSARAKRQHEKRYGSGALPVGKLNC